MIHVTLHACERFQQRVAPCSIEEARAAILTHARAIEKAAEFNCAVVRCGHGERLILEGTKVLTVYAAGVRPRQCRNPFREGGMA